MVEDMITLPEENLIFSMDETLIKFCDLLEDNKEQLIHSYDS